MIAIPRLFEELRTILPDIAKAKPTKGSAEAAAIWALVQVSELDERWSVGWHDNLPDLQGTALTGFRVIQKGDNAMVYDLAPARLDEWFDSALTVVTERMNGALAADRRVLPYTRSLAFAVACCFSKGDPKDPVQFERERDELVAYDRFGGALMLPTSERRLKDKLRRELSPDGVCFAVWGCLPGGSRTSSTDALGEALDQMELP
jgi:hypothetical protein